MDGKKEILGIWNSASESASFWTTVFPKTENQLCVIHMIRNSTKYVSYKDVKPIMADLKKVYTPRRTKNPLCSH